MHTFPVIFVARSIIKARSVGTNPQLPLSYYSRSQTIYGCPVETLKPILKHIRKSMLNFVFIIEFWLILVNMQAKSFIAKFLGSHGQFQIWIKGNNVVPRRKR